MKVGDITATRVYKLQEWRGITKVNAIALPKTISYLGLITQLN